MSEHVWERGRSFWDLAFLLLVVTAMILAINDADVSNGRRIAIIAVSIALVLNYTLIFRAEPVEDTVRGWVWFFVELTLATAAIALHPVFGLLLFVLYPHCWMPSSRLRWSIVASIVLTAGLVIGELIGRGFSHDGITAIGIQAGIGLVFAIGFGTYISRIIDQSAQRASLIEELESTRAELAAVQREGGMRDERERLAHEIHDTLAQGFTSIVMLLQAAQAKVGRDDDAVRRHLDAADRTARENLAEARSLVASLTPAPLQGASLADAVRRIADRLATETGVEAEVVVDGEPRALPPAEEVVLLRAVQEATANVRKHAGARAVRVCLTYGPDRTRLVVRDDGRGFDPGAADHGFGLPGMRRRIERAGGQLSVVSREGSGTTVEVVV
jgi:signal transduction histidine kinase